MSHHYTVIKGEDFTEMLSKKVAFILCIGNTKTAEIPGITVAGANPDLIKFTPPADAELLYYGYCKSIPFPPATPDGKPTPALITYTALKLVNCPLFVVDSGLIVKPKIPYIDIGLSVGENILKRSAMRIENIREAFERAKIIGNEISKYADVIMIAESIPAGTTTAGAVLKALGKSFAVSSSMPENPIDIKVKVIDKAVKRVRSRDVFHIISEIGDPVMVGVTGIAIGSKKPVVLAGGTQMAAIAHLINEIKTKIEVEAKRDDKRDDEIDDVNISIATTKYVVEDKSADMISISPDVNIIAVDPGLDKSSKPGLKAYAEGFVKEGVGAGGATLLAYANGITQKQFLKELEESYIRIIEKHRA